MKRLISAIVLCAFPLLTYAQCNPVTAAVRDALQRRQKDLVAAAQEMPPDKYGFNPTPAQMSFGHLVGHVMQSNGLLCSKLSGSAAPQQQVSDADPKEKLVDALKASFDFCSTALNQLSDARLGDEVTLFSGRKGTKAAAVIALTSGWADHYSAAAMYLRLNGLVPPTAKAKE
jgi:uncharacterized damage-inducible protein DinB